jgi:hypothetical protein
MTTMPFDTLKVAERLVQAGVPTKQARLQVRILVELVSALDASIVARFSSKEEVAQELVSFGSVTDKIGTKLDKLEKHIDIAAAEVKSEVIRWVVLMGILQMALIAGLVLTFTH